MFQANEHLLLQQLYNEGKFWIAIVGFLWAIFRGVSWVKSIKTNDLAHLKTGMEDVKTELKTQTNSIVDAVKDNTNEMKELRHVLITALISPPKAVAARARKKK